MKIKTIDQTFIKTLNYLFMPMARFAIFIVYFWFGALKLFHQSPAGPIASALAGKTVGLGHFSLMFQLLGLFECAIGILFLFPKAIRWAIPLLLTHLVIVSSPLFLVTNLTWTGPFVPTLEGQYIIKNIVIAALAIGIAAQTKPLGKPTRH